MAATDGLPDAAGKPCDRHRDVSSRFRRRSIVIDRERRAPASDGERELVASAQATGHPGRGMDGTCACRPPTGKGIRIERQVDGLCLSGTSPPCLPGDDHHRISGTRAPQSRSPCPHPGRTLTVIDPVTHALLLVGTDVGGAGELRPARRSALFAIDEYSRGCRGGAVFRSSRPASHQRRVRSRDGWCALDPRARAASPATAIASVDGLTRTLSLVDEPTDALTRRMRQRALAAATAPLRARSDRRLDLAEAMVALGLGSEARSVLLTAASDDPTEAASPRAALLAGIASVLDKRPAGADPFAAPNFPTTEEGKLWRALWPGRLRLLSEAQAATIRRGMPLLLSYPAQAARRSRRVRPRACCSQATIPMGIRAVDLLPDSDAIRLARARAAARLGHVGGRHRRPRIGSPGAGISGSWPTAYGTRSGCGSPLASSRRPRLPICSTLIASTGA